MCNQYDFNGAKCSILHLSPSNLRYQYWLGDEGIESTPEKKDLEVQIEHEPAV